MSEQRVVYSDDGTVRREFVWDGPNAVTHVVTENHDATLAEAKRLRDAGAVGSKDGFRAVAKIPITVIERSIKEGWFNDRAAWRKWLNDPDNRDFRIWEGRV